MNAYLIDKDSQNKKNIVFVVFCDLQEKDEPMATFPLEFSSNYDSIYGNYVHSVQNARSQVMPLRVSSKVRST